METLRSLFTLAKPSVPKALGIIDCNAENWRRRKDLHNILPRVVAPELFILKFDKQAF